MFSDNDFAFALKVGSMSWRRIKTTLSYKRKTDRNWAKIIIREKMLIREEIFNSRRPLTRRLSFTYVDYEIGSVSKNFLHIMLKTIISTWEKFKS